MKELLRSTDPLTIARIGELAIRVEAAEARATADRERLAAPFVLTACPAARAGRLIPGLPGGTCSMARSG